MNATTCSIISIISVDFFRCKFVKINIPTSKSFCGAWWHIKPHQVTKKIVNGKMEEYVTNDTPWNRQLDNFDNI